MNPYVKLVKPVDDYCLLLTFENGEKRIFDLKPYLEKPVFRQLKNITSFKTARIVCGSVEWLTNVDLSYDTLYLESKPAKEVHSLRKAVRGHKKNLAMAGISKKKPSKTRAAAK
jgi:hypothetical protein